SLPVTYLTSLYTLAALGRQVVSAGGHGPPLRIRLRIEKPCAYLLYKLQMLLMEMLPDGAKL
ncbi:MAG: hypothetical protein LUG44_10445, partial [Clostridiales bacterium]|nr:hypothetical protein [Clostridiales bacterium]